MLRHSIRKRSFALHRELIGAGRNDYHGDLHTDNVIVEKCGVRFNVKLLDMFHWGPPRAENLQADITDLIRIFYDVLGGQRYYRSQPQAVKDICCGLKRTLVLSKFRTAGKLVRHLETLRW